MTNKDLTYRQSIRIVLNEADKPLSLHEIQRQIINRQLRKDVIPSGIRSVLNKDVQKKEEAEFVRVKRGYYKIKHKTPTKTRKYRTIDTDQVLVFDINKLDKIGAFHGIREDFQLYYSSIIENESPIFINRHKAEEDKRFKQVVSYVIIKYKDKLLRFIRHESRINRFLDYVDGKYSIGFGGHVQIGDYFESYQENKSGYPKSVLREIQEEVGIALEDISGLEIIGVLNDDSTPRGKRHFAFLHILELAEPNFQANERWVTELELVSFDQLSLEFVQYEYWSKICLQFFFKDRLFIKCFVDKKRNYSLFNSRKYLAIVGGIGVGKSQICSLLEKRYDYINVPCSKILKEILGIDDTKIYERKEIQDAGYAYIESPGSHQEFAQRIFDYMDKTGHEGKFVLDGLRYNETLIKLGNLIKENLPIIYVENTIEMRHDLFNNRESQPINIYEFLEIVNHPVEKNIKDFLPLAKIIIYNNSPLDSLIYELSNFFYRELQDPFLWSSWDKNAKHRLEQLSRGNDITYKKILVPSILERIVNEKNVPSLSVLDVGCGVGELTKDIANIVNNVVGIDHSCQSIRIARENASGKNILFECAAIEDFMGRDQFDVVVANMTLHSVMMLKPALESIHKQLKPNGKFIFTIPHPRYYPERSMIRDVFKQSGYEYEIESFHRVPFTISSEPDPLPSPIPYFHRPTHSYDSLLDEIGFWLIETNSPIPDDTMMKEYPKKWELPHVMICVAKKRVNFSE